MPDIAVDAHRRRIPIDHPDGSVTTDKLSPFAGATAFFTRLASDVSTSSTSWSTLISYDFSLARSGFCAFICTMATRRDASGETHMRLLVDDAYASHGASFESEGPSYAPDITTMTVVHGQYLGAGRHNVKVQWKVTAGTSYCRPVANSDREGCALLIICLY